VYSFNGFPYLLILETMSFKVGKQTQVVMNSLGTVHLLLFSE
jgi:hypothetical protein